MRTEDETRNFTRDMDLASKEDLLILLVPTGDPEQPLAYEEGYWNEVMGQWHGPWRNEDGEGAYPHAEPIAFAEAPDEDDDGWDTDMESGQSEGAVLLKVPTGDPEEPISYEIGEWDEDEQRWHGAWRNTEGEEGDYSKQEPVAWCYLPDVDDDIAEEYGLLEPESAEA